MDSDTLIFNIITAILAGFALLISLYNHYKNRDVPFTPFYNLGKPQLKFNEYSYGFDISIIFGCHNKGTKVGKIHNLRIDLCIVEKDMNYSLYLYPDEKWTPMALRNNEYSEKYVRFLPKIEKLYITGDKISLTIEALVKGKKNEFIWKQIEEYPLIPLEFNRSENFTWESDKYLKYKVFNKSRQKTQYRFELSDSEKLIEEFEKLNNPEKLKSILYNPRLPIDFLYTDCMKHFDMEIVKLAENILTERIEKNEFNKELIKVLVDEKRDNLIQKIINNKELTLSSAYQIMYVFLSNEYGKQFITQLNHNMKENKNGVFEIQGENIKFVRFPQN